MQHRYGCVAKAGGIHCLSATPRLVWISFWLQKARPDLANAVLGAMMTMGSRWRQLPWRDVFVEIARQRPSGPVAQRRTFEAVALVAMTAQRRSLDLRKSLSALPPELCLQLLFFSEDSSASTLGMRGR